MPKWVSKTYPITDKSLLSLEYSSYLPQEWNFIMKKTLQVAGADIKETSEPNQIDTERIPSGQFPCQYFVTAKKEHYFVRQSFKCFIPYWNHYIKLK